MTDVQIERSVKLDKTPTDGSGTFTGVIYPFELDSDNERIIEIIDLPASFPVRYQHAMGDPEGDIGSVLVEQVGNRLKLSGKLNLENPLALLVYERMLLPPADSRAMHEFSIGFMYNAASAYKSETGEMILPKVKMFEVSIVVSGAQRTQLLTIKAAKAEARVRYGPTQVEDDLLASDAFLLGIVRDVGTLGRKTPPWQVEERDGQYCVVATETGDLVDTHETKAAADAHMRALYANTPGTSRASAPAVPDAKYRGDSLDGSWEYTEESVQKALQAWVDVKFPSDPEGDKAWTYRVGTYPDHVTFGVERIDAQTQYFDVTYQVDGDGNVTLGDPAEVTLDTVVAPSSTEGKSVEPETEIEETETPDSADAVEDGSKSGGGVSAGSVFVDVVPRFSDADGNLVDLEEIIAKVGRVVSSKSAASLKDKLSAAVDAFVLEVNGKSGNAAATEEIETKSDDDLDASLKDKLAAL